MQTQADRPNQLQSNLIIEESDSDPVKFGE